MALFLFCQIWVIFVLCGCIFTCQLSEEGVRCNYCVQTDDIYVSGARSGCAQMIIGIDRHAYTSEKCFFLFSRKIRSVMDSTFF